MKNLKIFLGFIAVLQIILFDGLAQVVRQISVDTTNRVFINFSGTGNQRFISVDGTNLNNLTNFRGQTLTYDGCSIEITETGQNIAAKGKDVILGSDHLPGWALKLPDGQMLSLFIDDKLKVFDFVIGSGATVPVTMRFSDGSAAEAGPGAAFRIEGFTGGQYYLSASSNVFAINADGQELELSWNRPPMLGGPLVEKKDQTGVTRKIRDIPSVKLQLRGRADSVVTITYGQNSVNLSPGETKTMEFNNESSATFSINKSRNFLACTVIKGVLECHIEGCEDTKFYLLTGQSTELQWDSSKRAFDLKNTTPAQYFPANRCVCIGFGQGGFLKVPPAVTLQCLRTTGTGLTGVSALGGEIEFMDDITGKKISIQSGKAPVGLASLLTESQQSGSFSLKIRGDRFSGYNLEWSGLSRSAQTGKLERIEISSQSIIEMSSDSNGYLSLRAARGTFNLSFANLPEWGTMLYEGNSVLLLVDNRIGILTVTTPTENTLPVVILTPIGFAPQLDAGSTVTFRFTAREGELVKATGSIAFFEQAGAGVPAPFAQAPIPIPNIIDPTRIAQPALSAFLP